MFLSKRCRSECGRERALQDKKIYNKTRNYMRDSKKMRLYRKHTSKSLRISHIVPCFVVDLLVLQRSFPSFILAQSSDPLLYRKHTSKRASSLLCLLPRRRWASRSCRRRSAPSNDLLASFQKGAESDLDIFKKLAAEQPAATDPAPARTTWG
jgi:hypothetical protein